MTIGIFTRKESRRLYALAAVFLALSIPISGSAQDSIPDAESNHSVKITVKEKGTGKPIAGAVVVLEGTEDYEETDDAGLALLPIDSEGAAAPITLRVLAPGYETLLVPELMAAASGEEPHEVYLSPFALEGETLEVSAERLSERASKFSLDDRELVGSAGSQGDPLKAVAAMPGVVPAGEDSAQVYMRGGGAGDNIVWVNRAPVGFLYHFGGFQSTINPALVQDVNIFPAGFPVKYGDALGGVIDVQLRPPKSDRMHYNLDISTIVSSALIEGPVGETGDSFYLAARRSYLDLLYSPEAFSDMMQEDEDEQDSFTLVPRFYDAQALYRHELSKGFLDLYFFAAEDKLSMDLKGSAKSDPELDGALRESLSYQTLGLDWRGRWSEGLDHVTTLAFHRFDSSTQVGTDENGEPFFMDVKTEGLYWQPEAHWKTKGGQTTIGLATEYIEAPVDIYMTRPPTENDPDFDFTSQEKRRLKKRLYARTLAPYAEYRWSWTDRLISTVGLRYSDMAISGGFQIGEFSPRGTLEYDLTPKTLLTASWGRYVQSPDAAEVVEGFGNPGLKVTEAEHRVVGIQQKLGPRYSVKAEAYHKPMKNLVVPLDENDPPNNYENEGTGEAYGVDLFLKREVRDRKMGWLTLSWTKTERTNELTGVARDFSGDRPLSLTAVWGQPLPGSWSKWEWSLKAQVHSGSPYTEITGRHREDPNDPESRWLPEYGKHNGKRTSAYYRMDARIGREVLFDESKLKFYLDLQNATFAKNVVGYEYGNEYEHIDDPKEIRGMPFFPYFGVEMIF